MARKRGGLINKLLLGSEKSEGYARASLPSNRWELFWDIVKGRFWKLVLLNLLILLFFLPLLAYILFKDIVLTGYGAFYPFLQGFGIGYQAPLAMVGYEQSINLTVNLTVNLLLPIVVGIAAIGVSGGAYVMRNMVWTEGIFVASDFWRGVKENYKQCLVIGLVFSLVFYTTQATIAYANQQIAIGSSPALFYIVQIASVLILCFFIIVCLYMITMCVTYDLSFRKLFKNAFAFTTSLLLPSLIFAFAAAIPFLLVQLGQFFQIIGMILIIALGFSWLFLVWTTFNQWAFDKFINVQIKGAKQNRGIYEKVKENSSASLKQYREQMQVIKTTLNSKPIKPITDEELKLEELPSMFNRADIEKLNKSREALYEDHARYVAEHINDAEFQKSDIEIEQEKADKEREKRIEKAKRELAKRNKNR